MRPKISKSVWDQIKIARAAGASYGEIAEKTGISKGTLCAHGHRAGWTKDAALAGKPRENGTHQQPNVADALAAILHDRGRATKMHLSEFLLKAAKQLAERDPIEINSVEGAKILESIRASLYPQPVQFDHRSVSLSVSGGLSEEALQKIEAMTKLM